MVRAQFPYWAAHNLNACGENLGLGGKIKGVLPKLKGKCLLDIKPEELPAAVSYCKRDAELCYAIYQKLEPGFPDSELALISMTTRLFCEPKLGVDVERASAQLRDEVLEKENLIKRAHTDRSVLLSNAKFAAALAELDFVAPVKVSPATGEETWAFSKNDPEFKDLLKHPDPHVVSLVKARLGVKSTIGETRAKRFVAEGQYHTLPVGLRYYGAHTGRWSGANKINLQNLPRGGELRKSIKAPPGYVIVVADHSQIECRMNAWLADDQGLLDAFRLKRDLYSEFASKFYGFQFADCARALRDHHDGSTVHVPGRRDGDPLGWSVCMHPGPGASATAASLVAELPRDPDRSPGLWCAMATPCTGVFLPVALPAPLPEPLTRGDGAPHRVVGD